MKDVFVYTNENRYITKIVRKTKLLDHNIKLKDHGRSRVSHFQRGD
jgi:hypothetical protein